MDIVQNVRTVMENIAAAAEKSGRRAEDITLIAASKMNDAAKVREAIAAGVSVCGENRVQELLEKKAQGAYEGAQIHLIGHLQKNKVRKIVGEAELIHSVDSPELMHAISRCALEKGIVQDILLEVNIGGEESKSGFAPADIVSALEKAATEPGIKVRGLMTIPPKCRSEEEIKPFFVQMYKLFIDSSGKKYDNVVMDFLSMGMSADYSAAIACGANMVRVGTAIFGARHYPEDHEQHFLLED